MRGRKRTPTVLALLRGNPGKRPLPANEPQAAPLTTGAPDILSGDSLVEWKRLCEDDKDTGVLSEKDRAALVVMCLAWGRVVTAERGIMQHGLLVKSPKGYPIQNPMLGVSRRWAEMLLKACAEFGNTPASRSRVAALRQERQSKLSRFVKSGGGRGA